MQPITVAVTGSPDALKVVRRAADRFERLNGTAPIVITSADVAKVEDFSLNDQRAAALWLWEFVPDDVMTILYYSWEVIPARPLEDGYFGKFASVTDVPGLFVAHRDTKPVFDKLRKLYLQSQRTEDIENWIPATMYKELTAEARVELPQTWNYAVRSARQLVTSPKMLNFAGFAPNTGCMPHRWRLLAGTLDVFDAAEEQHASEVVGQK